LELGTSKFKLKTPNVLHSVTSSF